MSNFAGQEIEGYKIQKPIGEGKFSTVYRAENAEGRTIALKKIKVQKSEMEIFRFSI